MEGKSWAGTRTIGHFSLLLVQFKENQLKLN